MTLYTARTRTVYFIRPIGMSGPIKIGCSCSPTSRRDTLATWSPFPLEIVAEISGSMDYERRFHTLFRDQHRGHEWFDWTPELQRVIEEVAGGTFDLQTLPLPLPLPNRKPRGNGWTERTRRIMSYTTRIRHVERKHNRFLAQRLTGWRSFFGDAEQMAPIDAYLTDPHAHGLSRQEHCRELANLLRGNTSEWARVRLAELEELAA